MSTTEMDLSIVIPVYNHEKYVKKCLETILEELPERTEIIIVDDCSTDNSLDVIKSIKSEHIKIICNEKNMGCAYSLNRAIGLAKGEYIGTNNSDDFVERGFYKKLLEVAQRENADVACANIADYYNETERIIYNKIEERNIYLNSIDKKIDFFNIKDIEVKAEVLLGHWTASSASTKIIRKELFDRYPYIGSKANDLTTIYPIMAEAEKIIYIPNLYMFYRQVPNSLSRRNTNDEYNSVIDSIVLSMKRMEKINNSNSKIELLFFNNCLSYFINVLCEIKDVDIKIATMKYFINKITEYRPNVFTEMKKSKFFPVFLKQNCIVESTFDLIGQRNLIDFLIQRKLDILISNNSKLSNCNNDLNRIISTLQIEQNNLLLKIQDIENINEELKNEMNKIKNSTSWKITKPIRDFKLTLNKIIGRK